MNGNFLDENRLKLLDQGETENLFEFAPNDHGAKMVFLLLKILRLN